MNAFLTFTLALNKLSAITVTLTFTRCLHPRKVKGKMTVHGQLKSFSFFFFLSYHGIRTQPQLFIGLNVLKMGLMRQGFNFSTL